MQQSSWKIIFLVLMTSGSLVHADLMTGMYSYMADSGFFLSCDQEERFPVAFEGDNAALESAYLKNRYMPEKSLLVTIEGHTAMRRAMEGDGQQKMLIVERFVDITQQERCTGLVPPSSLSNTYWKLVELEGQHLDAHPFWQEAMLNNNKNQREIYFIIKNNGDLIKGFSGCNRFSGSVTHDETGIQIGPLRSTRMACPSMAIEGLFLDLINHADSYKIKGESLELFQGEASIAKFIAIYF